MNNHKKKPEALRNSVEDLFTTVDDLLAKDQLSKRDQEWLEKELEEMEEKLKSYKLKQVEKTKVS